MKNRHEIVKFSDVFEIFNFNRTMRGTENKAHLYEFISMLSFDWILIPSKIYILARP